MVNRLFCGALTIGAVLIVTGAGLAAESNPLSAVPGSCNAVAVVQMKKLVNSPLGKRQKWFDEARRAYAEGLLSGPPWVTEIVQATTVGAGNGAQSRTYSIYTMNQASIIGEIATHELGRSEKLAGHGAVVSPRNVLFIQLGPGLVGAVQPADRDAALQWVQLFEEQKVPAISPDLLEALKTSDGAQVTIAVDLKGKLNSRYILNWLVGTPKLRATDDIEGLAKVLASLGMAHLSVQVSDRIVARLRLDFGSSIGKHAEGLEKAVAQWLDDAGARPKMIAAAKTSHADRSLTFEAPLDEVGLRRLLSLVQSPHLSPQEAANPESRKPNAVGTAAYYNKVCDLVNSLLRKNSSASDYEKTALWHEQFARRIAGLSTIGVDPDLVRWGRGISKELVALAGSLRGEVVKLDDLERSIRTDETTTYTWYANSPLYGPLYFPAWVSTNSNLEQVRGQQEAQLERGAGQRQEIWNMLYRETGDVARQMEEKYHIKLKMPN